MISDQETGWEPEISFDIKTGAKEIYRFLLDYSYTTPSGIAGLALSLASGVWLVSRFSALSGNERVFFGVIFALYTVVNPMLLWWKAKRQAEQSPYFSKPLHYELSTKGITVCSGEERSRIRWDMVVKVKAYGDLIVVYMSRINAFIWAKNQMENSDKINEILESCVDKKRLKFKR